MPLSSLRMLAPLNTDALLSTGFGSPTFTRASIATILKEGVLITEAVNVARFTGNAYLCETARTNELLQSRDLTSAPWVITTATVAQDAVGLDGVANAASTLTATAAGGKAVQTVLGVAFNNSLTLDIRRKTGTGTIEITNDDFGSSVVDVTALINSSTYTRVTTSGTNFSPTLGVRLGTNGDAIEVDYVQAENAFSPTSRIETLAVTVTRAQDALSYDATNWPPLDTTFTTAIDVDTEIPSALQTQINIDGIDPIVLPTLINGTLFGALYGSVLTLGAGVNASTGLFRVIFTWRSGGNQNIFVDTVLSGTNATIDSTSGAVTAINVGRDSVDSFKFNGLLSNFRIYDDELTQNEINNELGQIINGQINTTGINTSINTRID